jgi:tetratricopeptide (TPR) repeat protein
MTPSPPSRRRLTGRTVSAALVLMCGAGLAACSTSEAGTPDSPPDAAAPVAASAGSPTSALQAGLDKHVAGDLDGAAAEYGRALSENPDDVLALYNLGLVSQSEGEHPEAEVHYRRALDVDPGYQPAVFNLAILRHTQGDLVEAEQLYRRSVALRPNDASAHLNLGALLRDSGRGIEGDAEVAAALHLDPSLGDAARP